MTNTKITAEDLFLRAEEREEKGQVQEAFKDLLAAAKMGHTWSQVNLGNYFAAGKGIAADFQEAEKWYRLAANKGDSSAAYNLALDLEARGKRKSAMHWLRKAIELNHGEAYVALAKLSGNHRRKIELLNKAVSLHDDHITEESRDEAKALLAHILQSHKT